MRKAILITALIAGTLDGLAAILMNLKSGPVKIFQFIAGGLFGKQAFGGGWYMVALGVLIHYFITFIFIWAFFALCKLAKLRGEKLIFIGVAYGIVIWAVMNLIVLPLSKIPEVPFNWLAAVNGAVVLMLTIGLPAGVTAYRYFKG
ncbi:MAG: hypothetical protein INR69_11745 [Mucilaginibacter polytrichastri]|nr:hypothetical protein [Mucilaginibacter polytrichastri]